MGRGLLHLTILTANDLAKHERFGKQPCYVSIQLGNRTARSKTCKAGNGQAPVWNETLFIQLEKEQEVVFEVFVERMLMKDINIGSATLSLDRVLQHGTDDAELQLIHKGTQQGTLSISLELRRTGSQGTKLRSGSSSSSLASPASSASLAMTHSGSFGSSFTGIPGLKPSSLPVMLLQQPNLALYREQLLQQSAMLTAQAQQQQQQQQQQQWLQQQWLQQQGRQPSGAGPSSSTGGGAGPSKTTSWAPKRTVADLFADPANMDDISSRDIIGMLGATDSNFSGFDSVSGPLPTAGGAVDALRVQALVNAVYGGAAASAAHANTAQAAATATSQSSAAGANTASFTDGMGGGASSLCPPLAANLGGRGATGSSTVAGQAAAGEGPSGSQTRLMTSSLPPRPSRGMKPPPDGNFDPFQAAAFHAAAAAAAAGLGPPSPPPFGNTGSSSSTAQAGTSAAAAARGAGAGLRSPAGAGDLPEAFNMAALQAAAAAFAGAANTGSAGDDSDEQSDGEADAFLVGMRPAAAARAAAAGTATAGAWGDMPDPFGAGASGAAAAAAAATGSVAAAGLLLAGASSSSSNRPDAQQGLARVSRRAAASPALHTVAEGYEPPGQPEDVFGAAWAVAAAAAAGGGAAEHPTDQVAQHLSQQPQGVSPAAAGSSAAAAGSSRQPQGGLGTSAAADDSSDLRSLLLQTNKQLALLTKQLQERDVLVQQLQEQLQETQRELQMLRNK